MTFPLANFLESARGFEIIGFLFWIWMIFECAKREPASFRKVMWMALVIFVPDIGSIIYFLVRVARING